MQSTYTVILEPKKRKSVIASTISPSICHEVIGPDVMILIFLIFSLKLTFSLSSFTLIKRFFSSSSLSDIRVVSSAYLRLLIFLLTILILTCNSSNLAFCLMCCVYTINKLAENKQFCHSPFSILKQSVVPYRVLTVAS